MTQPQHHSTFRHTKRKPPSSVSSILHKKADQTMSTTQSDHHIQIFSVSALSVDVVQDCHSSAEPPSAQHTLLSCPMFKEARIKQWLHDTSPEVQLSGLEQNLIKASTFIKQPRLIIQGRDGEQRLGQVIVHVPL